MDADVPGGVRHRPRRARCRAVEDWRSRARKRSAGEWTPPRPQRRTAWPSPPSWRAGRRWATRSCTWRWTPRTVSCPWSARGHVSGEVRVRLGREATVGTPPDAVLLAPPLSKRSVARVGTARMAGRCRSGSTSTAGGRCRATGAFPVPWVRWPSSWTAGAVLYLRPAVGPLSDVSYVPPGSVRRGAGPRSHP